MLPNPQIQCAVGYPLEEDISSGENAGTVQLYSRIHGLFPGPVVGLKDKCIICSCSCDSLF